MLAAVYTTAGGPEVIRFEERPDPTPGPGQIRVRVRASALNRADVLQRRGSYPAPPGWPSDIPGLEYAGEVDRLGDGVTRWRVGDRVMGLVGGGAHAEYVAVYEDEAIAVPDGVSLEAAAAIPEAFLTAYDALVTRGSLARGERVLVHAAASGIGTAASQLARWLGATVLGTSRSADKLARTREYGVEIPIDTSRASFKEQVGDSVHLIVDVIGAEAFADNLAVLAERGRLVMLGHLTGSSGSFDLAPLLRKRLTVVGSVLRTRAHAERAALAAEFSERVLPRFTAPPGTTPALRPVVGLTLPMRELAKAHTAMERNETFGKVVLAW